jgi:tetratricopeptide (TPR) repeat protein
MQCPYCKEEINDGAMKCKICGELLGSQVFFKRVNSFIAGILSIVVSIGSLTVALLEYKGRVEAMFEKKKAEMDKIATLEILKEVPSEVILNVALRELKPSEEVKFEVASADVKSREKMDQYNELIAEAARALERGNKEQAERLYKEAARFEREFSPVQQVSESYASKGIAYINIEKNDPKGAVREYENAVKRDPEDIEARKGLISAQILYEKQRR